uniref:Ovule protein n=1 Tax=Mesocestoides corti TaxID=53468 RepID=A0A5K3FN52_MESCO
PEAAITTALCPIHQQSSSLFERQPLPPSSKPPHSPDSHSGFLLAFFNSRLQTGGEFEGSGDSVDKWHDRC